MRLPQFPLHCYRRRPFRQCPVDDRESAFAQQSGYIRLALENSKHFGWAAQDTFLRWQGWARSADQVVMDDPTFGSPEQVHEIPPPSPTPLSGWHLETALDKLSYAAHFLTDQYAAGHVRVERRSLPATRAKYEHDWDNHSGLPLRQSFFEGDDRVDVYWRGYGDGCLLHGESRCTRLLVAIPVSSSRPRARLPIAPSGWASRATISWRK